MLFKSPRGTKDILSQETRIWQEAESRARHFFSLFGYEEIRTPILEESKLFSRSLGDLTDIVQKQMFLIKKETETLVLRPEATASIVRAYVEHTLYNASGVSKFYYIGPMFRAERPQKGRLRQFHHIGCEAIGSCHPLLDAETIYLADRLLSELGLKGFRLTLNTLGCTLDKKRFGVTLREKLLPLKKSFCEDCQTRITKNIFRLLDCKNRQCQEIILSLDLGQAHICGECHKHFEAVKEGLGILGVSYEVNPLLVRGLDYYTRTVFEVAHPDLGAQDAVAAGGRYDHLVEELGGPSRGACGFALGVERVFLGLGVAEKMEDPRPILDCYIVSLGEAAERQTARIAQELRQAGVSCDLDFLEGSLKAKLRRADRSRAKFCLIVGDNELAKEAGLLRNMLESTQEEIPFSHLVERLKRC